MNFEHIPEIFRFTTAGAKFKDTIVSLNNISKWHRFKASEIKNFYKESISVWQIPDVTKEYKKLFIEFHLLRHNKRVLDSDNLGFIIKWTIDAIKEKGWVEDDDQITYIVFPAILDRKLNDTSIEIVVRDNN
jgi:hypothetical protein